MFEVRHIAAAVMHLEMHVNRAVREEILTQLRQKKLI